MKRSKESVKVMEDDSIIGMKWKGNNVAVKVKWVWGIEGQVGDEGRGMGNQH